MNNILRNLNKKKLLILGFGREGQSTLRFLRKYFPAKEITIFDQSDIYTQDKNVILKTGSNYLDGILEYDVIFKSPGITYKFPQIKEAYRLGKIYSQTRLFFDLCKGKIVGVTGTKGKSTTTTLIHEIIKNSGKKCILLGNIGKPCLDYLDKSLGRKLIFAFELSCHQLYDLDKSPDIAVFLNIFREHLDYYENFTNYFKSKSNITNYQTKFNYFIYNVNFPKINKLAEFTKAKALGFSIQKNKKSRCFCEDGFVFYFDKKIEEVIAIREIPLRGTHNLNNVMAAILVGKSLGINTKSIRNAIINFHPLEHRLQKVGKYRGIEFYDDTLATIPEATMAAIDSFKSQVGTLILGGVDRGQNFRKLGAMILNEKIENVVLFPNTGEKIWLSVKSQASKQKLPHKISVTNMEDAVKACFKFTPKGKIALLSSASPSFNIFKSYEEKSALFKKYIILHGGL